MIILDGNILIWPGNNPFIKKHFSEIKKRSFFDKIWWRGGEYWFTDRKLNLSKIEDWIYENCPNSMITVVEDTHVAYLKIKFKNKEDVMAFKLMWVD